jgi:hypothetical protein
MGRRRAVKEDCTYEVVSENEVPEGGWGWIAAFGLALMFVSITTVYYYVNFIVVGHNC